MRDGILFRAERLSAAGCLISSDSALGKPCGHGIAWRAPILRRSFPQIVAHRRLTSSADRRCWHATNIFVPGHHAIGHQTQRTPERATARHKAAARRLACAYGLWGLDVADPALGNR